MTEPQKICCSKTCRGAVFEGMQWPQLVLVNRPATIQTSQFVRRHTKLGEKKRDDPWISKGSVGDHLIGDYCITLGYFGVSGCSLWLSSVSVPSLLGLYMSQARILWGFLCPNKKAPLFFPCSICSIWCILVSLVIDWHLQCAAGIDNMVDNGEHSFLERFFL